MPHSDFTRAVEWRGIRYPSLYSSSYHLRRRPPTHILVHSGGGGMQYQPVDDDAGRQCGEACCSGSSRVVVYLSVGGANETSAAQSLGLYDGQ